MSQFLSGLAFDAINTFLVEFAETITYTPWQGTPFQIQAVINRDIPKEIQGLNGASSYDHEIMIANDPSAGVIAVNKGKDTVAFPNKVGGATMTFTVLQIIRQDEGMFHLAVVQASKGNL